MKKYVKKISLVSIFVFLFLGFSSVIYGRFTKQFNPEVAGFGITISSQENIMVSTTGESGTFKDMVRLEDLVSNTEVTLTPNIGKVTPFQDGEHVDLSFEDEHGNPAPASSRLEFDLYFIGTSDMNLYFKGSTSGVGAIFKPMNGDAHFEDAKRQRLLDNLRIGFLSHSTIYQPLGTGVSVSYTSPISANVYATSTRVGPNYNTFSKLGYSNASDDTIIATINKNEVTKVRVVIWLEEDGLGELDALCQLTLSIRFEAIMVN